MPVVSQYVGDNDQYEDWLRSRGECLARLKGQVAVRRTRRPETPDSTVGSWDGQNLQNDTRLLHYLRMGKGLRVLRIDRVRHVLRPLRPGTKL